MTDTFRTAGLAGYWLDQSEMWLAELPGKGVQPEAINDLRQNAKAAVHEAVEATERANAARIERLNEALGDMVLARGELVKRQPVAAAPLPMTHDSKVRRLIRRLLTGISPEALDQMLAIAGEPAPRSPFVGVVKPYDGMKE